MDATLTEGELLMVLDVMNGTIVTPGLEGRCVVINVEDSFIIYPGMYEEKWGVDKKVMLEKLRAMPADWLVLIEKWATDYWDSEPLPDINSYVNAAIMGGI